MVDNGIPVTYKSDRRTDGQTDKHTTELCQQPIMLRRKLS